MNQNLIGDLLQLGIANQKRMDDLLQSGIANQNLIDDLLQSGIANQKRIQDSKQEVPWINKGSAGLLCMGDKAPYPAHWLAPVDASADAFVYQR